MSTVINNPASQTVEKRVVVEHDSDSSGWAVAVVILIAVIVVGGYFFFRNRTPAAQTPTTPAPNATVNVTLPAGNQNGTSGGATQ